MKLTAIAAVAALGAAVSGCATVVEGTMQSVSVNSTPADGAKCTLQNAEGTWYVTTPGSVVVHKTKTDLDVTCRKDGYEPGHIAATSHFGAMTAGNLALGVGGVVIGGVVDAASGANYHYDTPIVVPLGQRLGANRPAQEFPLRMHCESPSVDTHFTPEGPAGFLTTEITFDVNTSDDRGAIQVAPGRDAHCTVTAQPGTTLASVSLALDGAASWTAGGRPARDIEKHVEVVDSASTGSPATGQSHSFTVRAKDSTQGKITLSVPVRYR